MKLTHSNSNSIFIVLFTLILSLAFAIPAYGLGLTVPTVSTNISSNTRSGPDVWVIDSTYQGHGQTVTDIVRNEAPNADVHFESVSNSERVRSSAVVDGIYKAVDNGADVINLSLGAPQMSKTLAHAIDYAQSKGVTVVAAAGNNGRINYPAAYDDVVSVGALNSSGNKAFYSSPAEVYADGRAYNGMRGTSFAAPRVAGRIAHKMYKDGVDSSEAKEYVAGEQENTRIGTSLPELVAKDILLDLLRFTLVKNILGGRSQNIDSNFSNINSNNYSKWDSKDSIISDLGPSSGIIAKDINGFFPF